MSMVKDGFFKSSSLSLVCLAGNVDSLEDDVAGSRMYHLILNQNCDQMKMKSNPLLLGHIILSYLHH